MNLLKRLWAFGLYRWAMFRRAMGIRTRNRRHFLAAERTLTGVLILNIQHIKARTNRGLIRWRELDNWSGAIVDFTHLLDQQPDHYIALFYRGMAFYRAGDYRASALDLDTFIRLAPHSRWVHHAAIQLENLHAIIDELPKMLPPPKHDLD